MLKKKCLISTDPYPGYKKAKLSLYSWSGRRFRSVGYDSSHGDLRPRLIRWLYLSSPKDVGTATVHTDGASIVYKGAVYRDEDTATPPITEWDSLVSIGGSVDVLIKVGGRGCNILCVSRTCDPANKEVEVC